MSMGCFIAVCATVIRAGLAPDVAVTASAKLLNVSGKPRQMPVNERISRNAFATSPVDRCRSKLNRFHLLLFKAARQLMRSTPLHVGLRNSQIDRPDTPERNKAIPIKPASCRPGGGRRRF